MSRVAALRQENRPRISQTKSSPNGKRRHPQHLGVIGRKLDRAPRQPDALGFVRIVRRDPALEMAQRVAVSRHGESRRVGRLDDKRSVETGERRRRS